MALIYRQAALDKFKPWLEVKGYSEGELNMLRAVIYELENLPDAGQEIIHCKDCKHHWVHRCMDSMPREICDLNQTFYDADVDFCSLAERRGKTE